MDVMVTIPDGTNPDGAIAELYEAGGHLHAEIRIPAPHQAQAHYHAVAPTGLEGDEHGRVMD